MREVNAIGRPRGFKDRLEDSAQMDFGFGLPQDLFGLDAHKHTAAAPVLESEPAIHSCGHGSLAHGVTCDACAKLEQ